MKHLRKRVEEEATYFSKRLLPPLPQQAQGYEHPVRDFINEYSSKWLLERLFQMQKEKKI